MSESITELVKTEHIRLKEMFLEFESKKQDFEEAKKILNEFKWNLEKHFFVENKAIFSLFEKIEGQDIGIIFDLMKEHGEIIELVKDLEDDLDENKIPDSTELKDKIISHEKIEDEFLYPLMDEKLNAQEKQEAIRKIKEIVR